MGVHVECRQAAGDQQQHHQQHQQPEINPFLLVCTKYTQSVVLVGARSVVPAGQHGYYERCSGGY
jgi:hypothetical protein